MEIAMVKGIDAAMAQLKEDPERPVTAEIEGFIIEMRYKGPSHGRRPLPGDRASGRQVGGGDAASDS
jgi:hypothetical protein